MINEKQMRPCLKERSINEEPPTYCGIALLLAMLFCLCIPSAILFLIAAGRCNAIYDLYYAGDMDGVQTQVKLVKKLIFAGLVIVGLSFISFIFVCNTY